MAPGDSITRTRISAAETDTLPAGAETSTTGEPVSPFRRHERLGRYIVLGHLGSGGMGTVFEAFDLTLDRRVAVKVLHAAEKDQQGLLREAQAMAKLSHPHVVQVYEAGEVKGRLFVAMELVQGQTLRDWMEQEPTPGWRECVEVFLQAGEGLAAAHAQGLVHRDFKPGNAIVDESGRVKVLDFGLVRQVEDPLSDAESVASKDRWQTESSVLSLRLTRTGAVMGTPAYMSLEQMEGRSADARSDQFSFCLSLYEALYGERPFAGANPFELHLSLAEGTIRPPPAGTRVPGALRRVLLRGLSSDPEQRWPSMEALLAELRGLVSPRHRRGWMLLGAAVGLTAVGVGIGRLAGADPRCDGATEQLAGVWDDARRAEVEAAIRGTELSYAGPTWERVAAGLDEYTTAWTTKHREICEATSVRQEQSAEAMDLRMACMRNRLVTVREVVGVLAEANADRVRAAVPLIERLPSLSRCDELDALRAAMPPPEDPQIAARVEALRERLSRADALAHAGEFDEAFAEAEAVTAEAEQLEYAPLRAEAWLRRGRARQGQGRNGEAEADLERAYLSAIELNHPQVELDALTQLITVVGSAGARPEAGLAWGKTALALAQQPLDEARVLNNIGVVLQFQGKWDEALERYERSLGLREEATGPTSSAVGRARTNIGGALETQGRLADALVEHRKALAIFEESLGPGHPHVAASLNSIGVVLGRQGDTQGALEHYHRALAIFEDVLGPNHPHVAAATNNIGIAQRKLGDLDASRRAYEKSLVIVEQAFGPRHPQTASMLNNIGATIKDQGDLEGALDYYQRALDIRTENFGVAHPMVAKSMHNIGSVLLDLGRLDDAADHLERALELVEQTLGPDNPTTADTLVQLALLAVARQDHAAARPPAERAVSMLQSAEGKTKGLAEARFALARALESDPEQRARARTLARQAEATLAELDDPIDPTLGEIRTWLAEHPG